MKTTAIDDALYTMTVTRPGQGPEYMFKGTYDQCQTVRRVLRKLAKDTVFTVTMDREGGFDHDD